MSSVKTVPWINRLNNAQCETNDARNLPRMPYLDLKGLGCPSKITVWSSSFLEIFKAFLENGYGSYVDFEPILKLSRKSSFIIDSFGKFSRNEFDTGRCFL